jgi:hypothetical protein
MQNKESEFGPLKGVQTATGGVTVEAMTEEAAERPSGWRSREGA